MKYDLADCSSLYIFLHAACQYLFQAPNHYIFHGAEVYSDSEDDDMSSSCDDSESEDSQCCSADAEEEEEESEAEDSSMLAEEEGEEEEEAVRGLKDSVPHKMASACDAAANAQATDTSTPDDVQTSTTHL